MSVTPASFRTHFPEFTVAKYPDTVVQFWIDLAVKMLVVSRWDTVLDQGIELYVAHNLAVGSAVSASGGSTVGGGGGPVSSKTVDKVSVTYDVSSVAIEDGGDWNATSYGRRFLQLSRMIGAGAIQL